MLLAPGETLAWKYWEHRDITLEAFEAACREVTAGTPRAHAACNSPLLKWCFAHMVAISGDHAESPQELIEAASHQNLLERSDLGVSCRNLAWPIPTGGPWPEHVNSMARTGIAGTWTYLRLLPDNRQHFQPDSIGEWRSYRDATADPLELQTLLAYRAFASHFLQDSFAAGHNGIDRGTRRQDYDHGYHDDMNGHGLFLRNSNGDIWHSYGDNDRLTTSRFLTLDYCAEQHGIEQLQSAVTDLLKEEVKPFDSRALEDFCRDDDKEIRVLSLWPAASGLFDLCFFADNCNKIEVIYAADEKAREVLQQCALVDGELVTCNATAYMVSRAMTLQIRNMLREMDGLATVSGTGDIERLVPSEYRALMYQEGGSLFINKRSFVTHYSPWLKLSEKDKYQPPSFRNWTAAVYHEYSNTPTLGDTTLSWSLMQKASDWREREDLPGFLQEHARMGLRFDIASDDGSFLDGIELNFGLEVTRPLNRVLGIELLAAAGVNDIWGGRVDRTFYYGGGLELNLHAGKNVFFLDVLSLNHRGSRIVDKHSLRVALGMRIASVSLSR